MKDYVIAHDVGTSSVKAAMVHRAGEIVATAEQSYPTYHPNPGWVEQDAEDYWTAIVRATLAVIESSDVPPGAIAALVFTTQSMGVIPVDSGGTPLRRNMTWVDGRAEEQAQSIMRRLGGRKLFKRFVGMELTGKDVLPKLDWLRENESAIYKRTQKVLDINGYLKFRATGRMVFEWSGACAYSFNLKKKDWNRLHFRAIGWDMAKMPELVRSIDCVGTLTAESATQLGLPKDVAVFGGCDDPQSAAIGAGATEEGDAHIYLGTSAWVAVTTATAPKFKNGAVCLQSADPNRNLVVGITESAGANLEWVIGRFFESERSDPSVSDIYEYVSQIASQVPKGSDRLVFTPWLLGERCPVGSTTTRGTLFNLGVEHSRGHIVRALFEGIGYNLRWILENFQRDFGFHISRLRVVGGGSRNELWMQILADVTGKEIETTNHPKSAGAIGAAMCAFVGLGDCDSFRDVIRFVAAAETYAPNRTNTAVYDACFRDYQNVYHGLRRAYESANAERFRTA